MNALYYQPNITENKMIYRIAYTVSYFVLINIFPDCNLKNSPLEKAVISEKTVYTLYIY